MPFFNYGSKNGMASILFYVRHVCRIYVKFSAGIVAFVNASSLASEQKTILIAWLNSAQEACMILETLAVTYEA